MSTWIVFALLSVVTVLLLAVPLMRKKGPAESVNDNSIESEKQRLKLLDEEIAAGQVDAKVAASERAAITRRILALDNAGKASKGTPVASSRSGFAQFRIDKYSALAVACTAILGAFALYAATDQPDPIQGPPGLPSIAASGGASPQPKLPAVDTMISQLANRLETNPEDSEGWRMLGWSYFQTQRYAESVDAYSRAITLEPESAPFQSAYGEALVSLAGGSVKPDALKAFEAALRIAPEDERARYFLALAKYQEGDASGAIDDWTALLDGLVTDSPWASRIRTQMDIAAGSDGTEPSKTASPVPGGTEDRFAALTDSEIQEVQNLTPEGRSAMIRSMVEGLDQRLSQNPKDAEGWVRLIRSRKVLTQADLAVEALDRALIAFADDPVTQTRIRSAAADLGVQSTN